MKHKRYSRNTRKFLLAALPLAVIGANSAVAQENDDMMMLEEVTVLATRRVDEPRSVLDAAVPIDVINAAELNAQGSTDMIDVLTNVVPSFNANREPISDAGSLVRPANLRGMPSDNTLVLVNGKRRHRGAVIGEFIAGVNRGAQSVDLNPLFGMAVKQVGVLRDGAAAQYGSDAIAGVLNFQLADDPDVRRFQFRTGEYFEGDGAITEISGVVGTSLGQEGFATLAFEAKETDATSRGIQDPRAQALANAGVTGVPDPAVIWGTPDITDDYKFIFNSAVEAGDDREAYAFGGFATRTVDGSFFYRYPQSRGGVYTSGSDLLIADLTPDDDDTCPTISVSGVENVLTDPTYISGVANNPNCFAFNEMFPGGFTPRFGGKVTDASFVAGLRGEWENGMTYDVSVSAGRSRIDYRISNTINASYGPNTPTDFNLGSQEQFERLINVDFTYPVDLGLASDLNIAFGVQHHREQFEIVAGQTESWAPGGFEDQGFSIGSNGFQGFSSDVSGVFTRESQAAYLDLEVDVTDWFLLAGALRYEDFDDFGSTVDGKIAMRLDAFDWWSFRGSMSTGFKAPTVGQSNLRRAATSFQDGQLIETLVVPPTNAVAQALGGEQLDPEESTSFTIGTVLSFGDLSITVDYFNIEVDDRISLTGVDIDDALRADLIGQGLDEAATISQVQFFVNDFNTETSGIDVVATYPIQSDLGLTDITLAYNQTDTKVTDLGTTISPETGEELTTISPETAEELERFQPDQRATLTLNHSTDTWNFLIRGNYYGEVFENVFNDTSIPAVTDPVMIFDAEVSKDLGDNFNVAVGAKNILDEYPDEWESDGQNGRLPGYLGAIYPLNHPAGLNGGFYYLRVTADF